MPPHTPLQARRTPLGRAPEPVAQAPKVAPAPAEKPAPVKHYTHVHPFWAFMLWVAGLVFFCFIAIGPSREAEDWLLRRDYMENRASLALPTAGDQIALQTALVNSLPRNCYPVLNSEGEEVSKCEPASAPVEMPVQEETPELTNMWLGFAYMKTMKWEMRYGPRLIAAAVGYIGGTFMFLLCMLLGSRRA